MPSYREELISQILIALGYQYLTSAQALDLRGGGPRNIVLTRVLEDWLRTHKRFTHKNRCYPFADAAIRKALRRVTDLRAWKQLKLSFITNGDA